jgi:RNA polymerase sigma-70 factor, ECF subfamily
MNARGSGFRLFQQPLKDHEKARQGRLIDQDQTILEQVRRGETRSFGVLVDRHKDRALTLALRLLGDRGEAEELVQDAFLRAYRNLDQFRGDARFSTWFYRILYNLCMTRVTRRRPPAEPLDGLDERRLDVAPGEASALERLEEEELHTMLAEGIAGLPERYRAVVTLFYVQEMNLDEVARVLDLPAGTVKTHLFRARALLKTRLTAHDKNEVRVA